MPVLRSHATCEATSPGELFARVHAMRCESHVQSQLLFDELDEMVGTRHAQGSMLSCPLRIVLTGR